MHSYACKNLPTGAEVGGCSEGWVPGAGAVVGWGASSATNLFIKSL